MAEGKRYTDTYLRDMGFPAAGPERMHAITAALNRAHELRQFEIESYWKRSQYFWLFQASAITLTGLIYSRGAGQELLLLASGVGAVTAQVGWLTARGAKFWQSNWEAHIDKLEVHVEGKLTQTVLYQAGGVRSSISKINERLYSLLLIAWLSFFSFVAVEMTGWKIPEVRRGSLVAVSVIGLILALGFILFRTRSSLNPGADGGRGIWYRFRAPKPAGPLERHDRSQPNN